AWGVSGGLVRPRAGDVLDLGEGRRVWPPPGRRFPPEAARFADGGRFLLLPPTTRSLPTGRLLVLEELFDLAAEKRVWPVGDTSGLVTQWTAVRGTRLTAALLWQEWHEGEVDRRLTSLMSAPGLALFPPPDALPDPATLALWARAVA